MGTDTDFSGTDTTAEGGVSVPNSRKSVSVPIFWQQAETAYKNGQYLSSAELYQQLIFQDPSLWQALYNTGNSFYKAGHVPQAIEYYWRAYQINPRNPRLIHNLNLCLSKTGETLSPEGTPYVLYRAANFFIWEEWLSLSLGFWLVFGFFFWVYFFKKRIRLIKQIIGISGALTLLGGLGTAFSLAQHKTQWMVLQMPGLLRPGPSETLPVTTQIPEGRIVKILKHQDDWYFIETRKEGLRGWIK